MATKKTVGLTCGLAQVKGAEGWRGEEWADVLSQLNDHAQKYPSHAFNCSCMQMLAESVFRLTTIRDPKNQRSLDYLLRIAMGRRSR